MKNQNQDFPVIPSDRMDDLHYLEYSKIADLSLFMAGNQFMVMKELVSAFKTKHPEIDKIYYETLPPGLELKQILSGGAFFRGDIIKTIPDVYTSVNLDAMNKLETAGMADKKDVHLYLHNSLTMMVQPENPKNIQAVTDLGNENIRISQPDPLHEDIAYHIMDMYREAGGDSLVHRIMEEKRAEGTTIYTIVHHRETPLRIRKKTVDVGVVWATEVKNARKEGLSFDVVEPGETMDQRDKINYYACSLRGGSHPDNGQKFLEFLTSSRAQNIYRQFGFIPA